MIDDRKRGRPTVIIIDDDQSVREALRGLFESVGLVAETHCSVAEFLAVDDPDRAGCIVLDIRLPGQSGLEFQEALARGGRPRSVVLISAHVDVAMAVRAMKAGAIDVLTKPVREQDLLEAVNRALASDSARREEASQTAALRQRYSKLTDRERQIMTLVVAGKLNKQIAAEVQLAEATVKLHRGHMMRKMHASSVADLVRIAGILEV
ncbi:DNA-binding response regulator [Rhizobium anhuiense]|jgi:FixJ family two-component response regulator|uniref:DNA-binding response regulator n=1 Tax=Rhizobium anhuiense TaxID=1184720 RepID=A0A432NXY1_9HYPH|nr:MULTISPECIES: response regulator [Rhizobium]MBB3741997.1 FixJ family two-component response regulator [Rhizobium sp. BK591]MBB4111837.1 FixJ family two-component response regulator [Rhizobium sp. BK226]MBB4218770.1 FixJ family two-component response regulator [Rhizobium sp. BK212]MBB4252000.1 FixJ family two-component response regulator [Rhizobium sp. BK008]PDS34072.1 DNA-binding response regulator [Rhizobium anhuiense]